MEYLHGEHEWFLHKCSHIEYKRLKKVVKSCRPVKHCMMTLVELIREMRRILHSPKSVNANLAHMFFSELLKEATDIVGRFRSRVKHLQHLDPYVARGIQRCVLGLRQCFKNDQQSIVEEGWMLIEYITMNAIAIHKILKKYNKVHSSANGKNFKSNLSAEHIELLQSPWLIELGAFCLNFNGSEGEEFSQLSGHFSCDFNAAQFVMTLMLPNLMKLEYDLTFAICLEIVFIFSASRACSAASVLILEGLKAASPNSKCPICREAGLQEYMPYMPSQFTW